MSEEILSQLGITNRLKWYQTHYDEKNDVSHTWNCFLHGIQGVISRSAGPSELQLHRLSFGPDISYTPMLDGLTTEHLQNLQRIKPGPISGVLLFLFVFIFVLSRFLVGYFSTRFETR